MTILADTNLLTRSAQPSHAMYPAAVAAVELLSQRGERLVLGPQNLYEFWVVATRPPGENGLGLNVRQAHAELQRIKRVFYVLPEAPAHIVEWERLVLQYDVKGKNAYDARLVASMNNHGVSTILTFNVSDFARYTGITVLDPNELVSGRIAEKGQPSPEGSGGAG